MDIILAAVIAVSPFAAYWLSGRVLRKALARRLA